MTTDSMMTQATEALMLAREAISPGRRVVFSTEATERIDDALGIIAEIKWNEHERTWTPWGRGRLYPSTHPWTPWGKSDGCRKLADGIVWYDTPSHGGFWLSPSRLVEFRSAMPGVKKTFAGFPWFEEDCDAAHVWAAFPEISDRAPRPTVHTYERRSR